MGPVIPASDRLKKYLGDLYTGEVLGPTERKIQNVMEPVGRFFEGLKNPLDPETGLPSVDLAGPVMVGATGAKNAAEIFNKIRARNPKSAAAATVAYLREKYPKIMALMDNKLQTVTGPQNNVGPLDWGAFSPSINRGFIYNKGINRTMRQYANTGAHEGYHGYQWNYGNRQPELVESTKTAIKYPSKGAQRRKDYTDISVERGLYEPPTRSDEYYDELGIDDPAVRQTLKNLQFQKYERQPVEVEARRAGSTAAETFRKFADQILPPRSQKVLDFNTQEGIDLMRNRGIQNLTDLLPILRNEGYTSFKFGHKTYPVQTPESLLGLPDSPRYWE